MEKCYEYFNCKEVDCVARKTDALQCWDIENILCKEHIAFMRALNEKDGKKYDICKYCNYYKTYKNIIE